MKTRMMCVALLAAIAVVAVAQTGAEVSKNISGTYVVYTAEKRIQTDAYEVAGMMTSLDLLTSIDGKSEQKIQIGMERKEKAPAYYRKSLDGVPQLRAEVEKDYIWFYEGEAKVGALTIEPYLMFFDPTSYAGYTLLVRSYNTAKGGMQTFPVVVPALQDYCEIELERHGTDAFTVSGKTVTAGHFRMALGKRETVNLWVDGNRVIAIQLATKGLTIVDDAYPDLVKEVRKVMNKPL